ncbi:MAG: hypothetical protein ABDH37_04945 [Candidatus Hydrothermales bacterium]
MKFLKYFLVLFFTISFCAKKNPKKMVNYHPNWWYRFHDEKIENMGTYVPCLRCHSVEGESPLKEAPSCMSCHRSEPSIFGSR